MKRLTQSKKERKPNQKTRTLLVLGPEGGGKTVLVRRLRALCGASSSSSSSPSSSQQQQQQLPSEVLSTRPTSGAEPTSLPLPLEKETQLLEVGGSFASLWGSYFATAEKILFVLDAGDVVQLSTAVALLGSLLCTESVRTKPVFVVLNKADLAGDDGCALAMRRLRADALSKARSSDAPLSFRVISALSGRGLSELLADLTR